MEVFLSDVSEGLRHTPEVYCTCGWGRGCVTAQPLSARLKCREPDKDKPRPLNASQQPCGCRLHLQGHTPQRYLQLRRSISTERHAACGWREARLGPSMERQNQAGDAKGKATKRLQSRGRKYRSGTQAHNSPS